MLDRQTWASFTVNLPIVGCACLFTLDKLLVLYNCTIVSHVITLISVTQRQHHV